MNACAFQAGTGDRTWFGRSRFILWAAELLPFPDKSADTQGEPGGLSDHPFTGRRRSGRIHWLLVLPFAARRFRFRRQIHQLFREPRVLTEEKAVGNKRLHGGHGPSALR